MRQKGTEKERGGERGDTREKERELEIIFYKDWIERERDFMKPLATAQ